MVDYGWFISWIWRDPWYLKRMICVNIQIEIIPWDGMALNGWVKKDFAYLFKAGQCLLHIFPSPDGVLMVLVVLRRCGEMCWWWCDGGGGWLLPSYSAPNTCGLYSLPPPPAPSVQRRQQSSPDPTVQWQWVRTQPMGWYDFFLLWPIWPHIDSHSRCVTTLPSCSSCSFSLSASQGTGAPHRNMEQILTKFLFNISLSLYEILSPVSDVGITRAREEEK